MKTLEEARGELSRACLDTKKSSSLFSGSLRHTSSWGGDAERHMNTVVLRQIETPDHAISPAEMRQMIRSSISSKHNVLMSIVPKALLIAKSCERLETIRWSISEEINELRFIVERYAVLCEILRRIENEIGQKVVKNIEELNEAGRIAREYGLGTRFDWRTMWLKPFDEMGDTSYSWDEQVDLSDMSAKNVLSAIDQTEKRRLKGLRPFYSFCCEFVHPNVGDAISCGLDARLLKAKDGATLIIRKISSDPYFHQSRSRVNQAETVLITNAYSFAADLLKDFVNLSDDARKLAQSCVLVSKKITHKAVKIQKHFAFDNRDLCPCGSGKQIRSCLR